MASLGAGDGSLSQQGLCGGAVPRRPCGPHSRALHTTQYRPHQDCLPRSENNSDLEADTETSKAVKPTKGSRPLAWQACLPCHLTAAYSHTRPSKGPLRSRAKPPHNQRIKSTVFKLESRLSLVPEVFSLFLFF